MPDDIDMDAVRRFLAKKDADRAKSLVERLERARADFRAIVDLIIERYAPQAVWQWGSLLQSDHFSEISDIDIALEGLAGPEVYFALLGDAMKLSAFPLDIIELEKVGAANAAHIKRYGKMVYENKRNT